MIQILLVDDHPAIGHGTKYMLEQEGNMEVTVVSSGMEALELINDRAFDLFLLDMNMSEMHGLDLAKKMLSIDSDAIILIYTGYEIDAHFNVFIETGVAGFISKTVTKEQLLNAIQCSLRGEAVIPIRLLKQLRRDEALAVDVEEIKASRNIKFNKKELDILDGIAKGKRNRDIAHELDISQRAVEHYLTRIFEKMRVQSRAEAVTKGKQLGLLPESMFIK